VQFLHLKVRVLLIRELPLRSSRVASQAGSDKPGTTHLAGFVHKLVRRSERRNTV